MTNLLFHTPWWLPTLAVAMGLFVLWTGNQRQEKSVIRGGFAIILIGVLIALVSYLVETPVEKAERRTRQLVAAVGRKDWKAFHDLIDRETRCYSLRGPDEITNALRPAAESVNVGAVRITGMTTNPTKTLINVVIRVYAEVQGQSSLTDWQLQFQNLGKGWVLYDVKANSGQQISEEQIRRRLGQL